MSLDTDGHAVSRRKALKVAVSCLCSELGFGSADDCALETLTETLQAFLCELGRSTRAYTELSCRTESNCSDVILALVQMGLDISSIPAHAKRQNKSVFIPPGLSSVGPTHHTLQVGDKLPHPPHIPSSLPPFPDPHTYIKTEVYRRPVKEYPVVREKAATTKLHIQRALTRLIAKTGETHSLFQSMGFKESETAQGPAGHNNQYFPLIAVKPCLFPYLDALISKDQDLHVLEQDSPTPAPVCLQLPSDSAHLADSSRFTQGPESTDTDAIDNPYLRAVRVPNR